MYEKNLKNEEYYLKYSIEKFKDVEKFTKKRLELLPTMFKEDPFQLADLIYKHELKLKLIKRLYDKPYFARLDFTSDNNIYEKCYIGKVGVSDENSKIITVDWRAPVASMYYDSNLGEASYEAPEGIIKGNLSIKRQFNIEEGQIVTFQDVDSVSNDDMLKPFLNANADNRLKNIVATIQAEQNNIIRESINKNIVVQGVAGSGKTTVALHRIAYLVYNYIDLIKPENYLVIGPNKFFINYISGVLPDLDVNDAKQLTYFEIVQNLVDNKLELIGDDKKLSAAVNNKDMHLEALRTSLTFKDMLDEFIGKYLDNIIPEDNFKIRNYDILSSLVINKIYEESDTDSEILSIKMDKFYTRFSKFIKEKELKILYNIRENYFNNKDKDPDKKNLIYAEKEIKSKCGLSIRSYMKKTKPNIILLYIEFLKSISHIDDIYFNKLINSLKKKKVEFEDLAPLLYLHYRFYGSGNFTNFKHTVIDEAQDLGEFNFYVLNKILSRSTFSIFGDLAQSIYSYRSIKSWDDVKKLGYINLIEKTLEKSYRTTEEIMFEANKITKYLNLNTALPVLRHGNNVQYLKTNNKHESISNKVIEFIEKKYKSIAVICKDENETTEVYDYLKESGITLTLITGKDLTYNGGVCVITSYLAKGLEFDAVIISDASGNIYLEDRIIDLKLLYVALTRALHELTVVYTDKLLSILGDKI